MVAFAIKAPLYPFHGWVPDCLPRVAARGGGAALGRGLEGRRLRDAALRAAAVPGPGGRLAPVLLSCRAVGLLWCSLVAFRQPDSRGVIAYSSIAQMGLIALGIFVLNDQGGDGRGVPDGQPRPALGAPVPASPASSRCASAPASSSASARWRAAGPRWRRSASPPAWPRWRCPGRACSPPSSWCCWASFRELADRRRSRRWRSCWRRCTCSAGSRPSCTTGRPSRSRSPSADAGGVRDDVRWEAVYLVPLIAAVLALSVYPYCGDAPGETRRCTRSRAPAALEAGSDPDAVRPVVVDLARSSSCSARPACCCITGLVRRGRDGAASSRATVVAARVRRRGPGLAGPALAATDRHWLVMSGQLRADRFADARPAARRARPGC